jgi:hypothetical protein
MSGRPLPRHAGPCAPQRSSPPAPHPGALRATTIVLVSIMLRGPVAGRIVHRNSSSSFHTASGRPSKRPLTPMAPRSPSTEDGRWPCPHPPAPRHIGGSHWPRPRPPVLRPMGKSWRPCPHPPAPRLADSVGRRCASVAPSPLLPI